MILVRVGRRPTVLASGASSTLRAGAFLQLTPDRRGRGRPSGVPRCARLGPLPDGRSL